MPMTLAQKILARASGRSHVEVGEIVRAEADWLALVDLGWFMVIPVFAELGAQLKYPERLTVHLDHASPAATKEMAAMHASWRSWCVDNRVDNLFDLGARGGISHTVLVQQGYAAPGRLLVHQDSQANTIGAVGCYATALGVDIATDMALGWNWHRVPETIRIELYGDRPDWLPARDIMQNIIGVVGAIGALGDVVEFGGPVVDTMSMDARLALCNWTRKIEAVTALINPDKTTLDYVGPRVRGPYEPLTSDADAEYRKTLTFDVGQMEPVVACPPNVADTRLVSAVSSIRIDQAFVGSCAGGMLEDIRAAAAIVAGHQVAPGVRLIVTPASQQIWHQAAQEGLLETLSEAGALITNSTCGTCWGGANGVLADGEVCIASSTENTIGRMGSRSAHIYLASPATVAASAIAGHIADPRLVGRG
jgi:3-isopropylmalate/(R)-2-methylmalate dehydratase large subunit